jgi:hypothetical protein
MNAGDDQAPVRPECAKHGHAGEGEGRHECVGLIVSERLLASGSPVFASQRVVFCHGSKA